MRNIDLISISSMNVGDGTIGILEELYSIRYAAV